MPIPDASGDWASQFASGPGTLDDINIDDFFPLLFGAGFTSDPLADLNNSLLQSAFGGNDQQGQEVNGGDGIFDLSSNSLGY